MKAKEEEEDPLGLFFCTQSRLALRQREVPASGNRSWGETVLVSQLMFMNFLVLPFICRTDLLLTPNLSWTPKLAC